MLGSGFHPKQTHMETNPHISNFCIIQTLKIIELRHVKVACYFSLSIILFTNKELGVTCLGEYLLDQRSWDATFWPSILTRDPVREHLSIPCKPKGSLTPSLHLPVHHSVISLAPPYSMTNSCQLVAGFTPWTKVDFINTISGFHSAIRYPATVAVKSNNPKHQTLSSRFFLRYELFIFIYPLLFFLCAPIMMSFCISSFPNNWSCLVHFSYTSVLYKLCLGQVNIIYIS